VTPEPSTIDILRDAINDLNSRLHAARSLLADREKTQAQGSGYYSNENGVSLERARLVVRRIESAMTVLVADALPTQVVVQVPSEEPRRRRRVS
jgi:hypothetical protein